MTHSRAPSLEPMTLGSLLDRGFRLYGEHFALLLGIVAVAEVPYYAFRVLLEGVTAMSPDSEVVQLASAAAQLVGFFVLGFLCAPLATGAATFAIGELYLGREVTIAEAYKLAWRRLGTLVNAQITVGLRVMLGFLLLIVPGILWSLSYAVVTPVVMLEDLKSAGALKRSKELVHGHRGKVFALNFVVLLSIMFLAGGAGALVAVVLDVKSPTGAIASTVVQGLASVLTTPLQVVYAILLYYDLRIRKEGFDLEMLSLAMSGQGNPAASKPAVL